MRSPCGGEGGFSYLYEELRLVVDWKLFRVSEEKFDRARLALFATKHRVRLARFASRGLSLFALRFRAIGG